MTRTALIAAGLTLALTGCAPTSTPARPRVARTAISLPLRPPVTVHTVRGTAAGFMRAYLRVEVDRARPADRRRLLARSTHQTGRLASLAPRPTNHGYSPAGHLQRVQVLPTLTPGRWTVQARVRRAARTEWWELHLAGGPDGPLVTTFQTTSPRGMR